MIEQTNIKQIFADLDQQLGGETSHMGTTWQLIICGGAALISLGIRSTSTVDIDVLEPDLDAAMKQAAAIVGSKHGLAPDWINNGPKDLVINFATDWHQRLSEVYRGKRLTVQAIGRPELILSKVFAEADRQEDLDDILALQPTATEIESAARLVATFDAHPDWPKHVERTAQRILKRMNISSP